jgi:hypothetical protein
LEHRGSLTASNLDDPSVEAAPALMQAGPVVIAILDNRCSVSCTALHRSADIPVATLLD